MAFKVLGSALTDRTDIARFHREAQAIAKLHHDGIAGVYFVGQDRDICYLAMEYIDGMSVRELMKRLASADEPGQSIDDVLDATSSAGEAPKLRYDDQTLTYPPGFRPPTDSDPDHKAEAVTRLIASAEYIRQCCEIVRDAALPSLTLMNAGSSIATSSPRTSSWTV